MTQLEKKKQNFEKSIAKLKSQGTSQTTTKKAAATEQTSTTEQTSNLLTQMGKAYQTDISQQGYDSLAKAAPSDEE